MIFVLSVQEAKREILGAVTHVDGSARVQTVSRDNNPLYCQLISEFEKITGIPILLNTSFNNNAEPIVDNTEDAIVCFLTTGIHYLAVGNYLAEKKPKAEILSALPGLTPELPVYRKLVRRKKRIAGVVEEVFEIESTKNKHFGATTVEISRSMYAALNRADGETPFRLLVA